MSEKCSIIDSLKYCKILFSLCCVFWNQISMTSSDLKRLWFIYTLRDLRPPQSWHRIRRFFLFARWHREWWQVWRDCLCFRSNEIIISRFKWHVGCRCRAMYSLVNDSRRFLPFSTLERKSKSHSICARDSCEEDEGILLATPLTRKFDTRTATF